MFNYKTNRNWVDKIIRITTRHRWGWSSKSYNGSIIELALISYEYSRSSTLCDDLGRKNGKKIRGIRTAKQPNIIAPTTVGRPKKDIVRLRCIISIGYKNEIQSNVLEYNYQTTHHIFTVSH